VKQAVELPFARFVYGVRIGYLDAAGLAPVPASSPVVFVMNHRSNIDYTLVAFLAYSASAIAHFQR
jgi:glycerol-3-phosphate O-acyltransferase